MGRLKTAAPWAIAESLLTASATFLSAIIVARLLTAHDFGLAGVAIAISALLHAILAASLIQATIRMPSAHAAAIDTAFTLFLVIGLGAALLCWPLGWIAADIYGEPSLLWLVGLGGLDCLFQALAGLPTALLRRKMRTKRFAVRTLVVRLVTFAVTLCLAISGAGAWTIVGGQLLGNLVGCVILWRGQRRPRLALSRAELGDLSRTSLWISAEQGISALTVRGFTLLFGLFHGMAALGLLNFAIRIIDETGNLIVSSVNSVSLAAFASIQRAGGDLRTAFERGTHFIMLLSAPMFFGLAAVAPVMVPILFGDKWSPAVPALQLLAFFWALRMSRILAPVALRAVGYQRSGAINAMVALAATAVALWLTRDASFTLAVVAYGVRVLVTLPLGYFQLARFASIPPASQGRPLGRPLIAALAMAYAVYTLDQLLAGQVAAMVRLICLISAGCTVYIGIILLIDRRSIRDLLSMIRRR